MTSTLVWVIVALAYSPVRQQLYGAQMGRDQLHDNWPDRYTVKQGAHLPAEQLFAIDAGDDLGWPYCYYDRKKQEKVLAPEYGGDGRKIGRCDRAKQPLAAYPAHWSPMDVLAYDGQTLPARYRHGVFIAFHGSWNRSPYPQAGFRVVFQPLAHGRADSPTETFVAPDAMTGHKRLASPRDAEHRPAGLAQGPKGAIYLADDAGHTIYRIRYIGQSK